MEPVRTSRPRYKRVCRAPCQSLRSCRDFRRVVSILVRYQEMALGFLVQDSFLHSLLVQVAEGASGSVEVLIYCFGAP